MKLVFNPFKGMAPSEVTECLLWFLTGMAMGIGIVGVLAYVLFGG